MESKHLPRAWKRGTDFLGTRYAILCGAMTWVSDPGLVAAVSEEGGFGVLAGGNMPPDLFAERIAETRRRTKNPFGVNLITIAPAFRDQVRVAVREKCPFVFFAGGVPSGKDIAEVKAAGLRVVCFAPALPVARRLIREGADALVIEGHEAGGHVGPVATSVLVQEVLPNVAEVPVFVAGGIGIGEMIAQYLAMGAAGVQLGTRFAAAEESPAHPRFKEALVKAAARDAMPTSRFDPALPTIPVRAIVNAGTRDFNDLQLSLLNDLKAGVVSREEAAAKLEEFWIGALRRAVAEGDVEHGSLMAGQSAAFVKKIQPVREILAELVAGAENALARMAGEE